MNSCKEYVRPIDKRKHVLDFVTMELCKHAEQIMTNKRKYSDSFMNIILLIKNDIRGF